MAHNSFAQGLQLSRAILARSRYERGRPTMRHAANAWNNQWDSDAIGVDDEFFDGTTVFDHDILSEVIVLATVSMF
ncbi:hypothetical protein ECTHUN299_55390 [Escherichia coli]|nr:hypothetical protein ECTHUN299_55390 [Escherichia coli]